MRIIRSLISGFGKHKEDYIEEGMVFCMGGPGFILSRGMMKILKGKINSCADRILTEHEDIEIGRCIWHLTGIVMIFKYL